MNSRIFFCFFFILLSATGNAQVPHPSDVFGFMPGDDYKLANYDQMLEYYKQLDAASDRVTMREIGRSVLDKPLLLLYISSEENLKKIDEFRNTSEKLARAEISKDEAVSLSKSGKSIVWIDGGLHATEVAAAQMTTLLAHDVATEESAEMQHIRDKTIMLLMPVMNPDGLDIVASWYERNLGTAFEMTRPPWLYHHYVGHDNNRDWFMNNMPESEAVTRVLYNEWFPQIVYNHHQTGPSWTRIFIPPFADPVNPNIHPGVTTSVNLIGSAMANRFAIKEMPGAVSGVIYSMWWNGGMRTVPYFHNMVGILTETSHATPSPRFYDPEKMPKSIAARRGGGHPTNGTNIFYPYPWQGGESTFSQPVSYMYQASMAVLKLAADLKEQFLFNIYKMGRDAIDKRPEKMPTAYIIPENQWNDGEEISLLNVLGIGGIQIHRSRSDFSLGETSYPKGTYVIFGNQSFRPYLSDLLEKQEYPDRRVNGRPETPYDLAGWTLPLQMGIHIDRTYEPLNIDVEQIQTPLKPIKGNLDQDNARAYLLSNHSNLSYKIVNTSLKEDVRVFRLADTLYSGDQVFTPGSFYIETPNNKDRQILRQLAEETGLVFCARNEKPINLEPLQKHKIGLYKSWVANMDEGWTRWLLEEYNFDFVNLTNEDIIEGDLSTFSAILLPSQGKSSMLSGHKEGTMPAPYTGGIGLEGSLKLKQFVDGGGNLIALDAASDFVIDQFGLPVRNSISSASSNQFFIPGSLVKIEMNTEHDLTQGMQESAAAYFVRSRAFETITLSKRGEGGVAELPDAPKPNVKVIVSYADKDILMSGWALGENQYLKGKAAMIEIPQGKGSVVLFGFRPQFRGQPKGTYKLLFNSLY